MPDEEYLIPTMEDYKAKVVIQPGDESTIEVTTVAALKRFVTGEKNLVSDGVLRAIVHDWLLLTGTIMLPDGDGGKEG